MQGKEVFLKSNSRICYILIFIIFLISNSAKSSNNKLTELVNYLHDLNDFTASFIQNNNEELSEGKISINRNVQLIQVCIALCPLFGLMGTVTGMIEVFQVMAFTGGGDARSMAGGVSKATLPTMAGMVSSLSGVLAMIWVKNQVESNELMMVDYVTGSSKQGAK